jgi:hypothetical protein
MPTSPRSTVPVVVTERDTSPPDGQIARTDVTQKNILVVTMTPFAQALVRFARTYLQGLVGFLLLALTARPVLATVGVVILPGDFLDAIKTAAGLAVAPAVISLLQNFIEILTLLDEKFPKLRA